MAMIGASISLAAKGRVNQLVNTSDTDGDAAYGQCGG